MRSLILSFVLFISCHVDALKLPVNIRTTSSQPSPRNSLSRLTPRATNTTIDLANNQNAQYIANITLGGLTARVLVDTGSSDLWVDFPNEQPVSTNLGKSVSLTYAIGSASGSIHTADLEFGDYSVKDQAFLLVSDASSFSSDIHSQGYDGLMGLGPNDGSQVLDTIDKASADSVLSRIFQSNRTMQNFVTILLDRKNDPTMDYTGQITVSEIVAEFPDIVNQPKLDVEKVHMLLDQDQHWQGLTDKDNGVIGPDGKVMNIKSIVPRAPSGQLVAVFDSGFTFNQVPREMADAIYGRVQGAVYDTKNEWWTVPCGQMLNVSFNFGGQSYPIHPLDTVDDNFGISDAQGNTVCIGAFQPITTAFSILGHYDMILGMSFMRNVYTLLDFGDWIDNTDNKDDPFIQLLALTDPNAAYDDFVQRRLKGVDTVGDAKWALLPEDQKQASPVSDEEKKKKYQEMILSRWPYIFTGCLVAVLLIIAFVVWKCCCGKRRKAAKAAKEAKEAAAMTGKKGFGKASLAPSYAELTPHGNSTTSLVPPSQPQYGQQYSAPYDGRPSMNSTRYDEGQYTPYSSGHYDPGRPSGHYDAQQYAPNSGHYDTQYSPGAGYGGGYRQ